MLHDIILASMNICIKHQSFCDCCIICAERIEIMKKQPELTAMTKQTIIDAFFQITAEGKKATVGAVTERAGYNRCTFYRYFMDTEQLLSDVETEICDAFEAALSLQSSAISPPELIRSFVAIYQQYGDYLSVLLGENGDFRFVNKMKAIIHPMAQQLFTANSTSNIAAALKEEFVLSAVLAIVTKWYEMKQPISVSELGMLIMNVLQNGIF